MVDLATKLASVMVAEEQRQPYQAAQNQLTVERDGEGGARITELAAERLNLLGGAVLERQLQVELGVENPLIPPGGRLRVRCLRGGVAHAGEDTRPVDTSRRSLRRSR